MIQIGIRVHDGENLPLEQLLPILHDRGFCCGHIALGKSIKEYSTANSALTPGFAAHLKHLFDKNQMDIAVLGCYLDLCSPNTDIERYKAHIRLAAQMGVGVVGTETNGDGNYGTLIQNIKQICEYAEKMGVMFAIEPVVRHIVATPEIARKVLDDVNSPNLGIIFDPVNLLDENNYHEREKIHARAMELLGKDIMVVHIKDFLIENGKLNFEVPVGHGNMDYHEIFAFLKKEKPYIQATLENTNPAVAVECRQLVEKIYSES